MLALNSHEKGMMKIMIYREFKPPSALSPFIKCFWCLERDYKQFGPSEALWAKGDVELLFHFGDRYVNSNNETLSYSFLIGPLTKYTNLISFGKVKLVGARFHPGGFAPFFRISMNSLRNQIVPLSDLIGGDAEILEERLFEAGLEKSISILQHFLLEKLCTVSYHPIAELAKWIVKENGMIPLPNLEQLTGLSLRQLERKFNEFIGFSPKKMATIYRFNAAREHLRKHPEMDVLDLAFHYGYYDYSHFSKDFRKYLGITPTEFKNSILAMERNHMKRDVVFLQDE
ncbi:AraC family transcriptional regulator [Parageobacillus sp. KH3-4]|nr:AraC family transcriptional regulator [Parageobacillus sp. KH3-4]